MIFNKDSRFDNLTDKQRHRLYRKEKRIYFKRLKTVRKRLVKLSKEFQFWDYDYFHQIVNEMINGLHIQYTFGENFNMCDSERERIEESLFKIVRIGTAIEADKINLLDDTNTVDLYRQYYNEIGEHILDWWD